MWLQQKQFTFSSQNGTFNVDDISSINTKINDALTTIKLNDLFLKINDFDVSKDRKTLTVSGWSILQNTLSNIYPIINSPERVIKLSFYDENVGEIELMKIKNELFQLNDKQLSDENVAEFEQKIIELATAVAEQAEETNSPHGSSSVVNSNYERAKQRYINSGYREIISSPYRFLTHETKRPILVEIIDENELLQYIDSTKIAENFYQFEDKLENRKINVKLIDNELKIESISNPVAKIDDVEISK